MQDQDLRFFEDEQQEVETQQQPEVQQQQAPADETGIDEAVGMLFGFNDYETEEEEKEEQEEQANEQTTSEENQQEQQTEEENMEEIKQEVDELSELVNSLDIEDKEEEQEQVEELQQAVESGDEEEILQKLNELEAALEAEKLEKEWLQREKEMLLQKIQELRDKINQLELKTYDYSDLDQVFNQDWNLKAFVKLVALYKMNPEAISKQKLIDAVDRVILDLFGVSVKDLLEQEAKKENEVMKMGREQTQPIEIEIKDNSNNLDDYLNWAISELFGLW